MLQKMDMAMANNSKQCIRINKIAKIKIKKTDIPNCLNYLVNTILT